MMPAVDRCESTIDFPIRILASYTLLTYIIYDPICRLYSAYIHVTWTKFFLVDATKNSLIFQQDLFK